MANRVHLLGHVGRDPEVRSLPNGQSVANFSLATTERWRDSDGNKHKKTEWHNIVVFGKLAEAVVQPYVSKGTQLYAVGKLQARSWEDRNSGEKRYRTEVVVNEIELLGGRPRESAGEAQEAADFEREVENAGSDDSDIPF